MFLQRITHHFFNFFSSSLKVGDDQARNMLLGVERRTPAGRAGALLATRTLERDGNTTSM